MGKKPPVVITRKDKKLKKTGHLLAFMLTGGASSVVTAGKAASNASYNAQTRKLAATAQEDEIPVAHAPEASAPPEPGISAAQVSLEASRALREAIREHAAARWSRDSERLAQAKENLDACMVASQEASKAHRTAMRNRRRTH